MRRVGEAPRGERVRSVVSLLLWLWVLLVVLYFSWETVTYRGLYARLSEWQFDRLGQNLPTLNFICLTLLFTWPVLILAGILRRGRVRLTDEERAAAEADPHMADRYAARHDASLSLSAARDYTHFLSGFAAALGLAALASLLWTLTLPRASGELRPFAPATAGDTEPTQGPTSFEGQLTYGRIASFSRGILFFRRTALYAPLLPASGQRQQIRYFVEFLPSERADIQAGGRISHRAGILLRSDLPGALIRLYRYLGYDPAPRYYVLYASADTMRWPYFVVAMQFAIGALLFLILAAVQRSHIRRVNRAIAAEDRRLIRRQKALAEAS